MENECSCLRCVQTIEPSYELRACIELNFEFSLELSLEPNDDHNNDDLCVYIGYIVKFISIENL